jgi:hypothetical protein
VLNSDPVQSDQTTVPSGQRVADVMRLPRLVAAQVESAGSDGARLAAANGLLQAARRIPDASPEQGASARMPVRDLVWRVDSARFVRFAHGAETAIAEAVNLPDTSDIHLLLRQEPQEP